MDIGSTLVRAITAFVCGGHSRRVLLRDSYLGVNFNDTRTWGCVMLMISAIGCSDRLLCRGADRGDQSTWLQGMGV